MMVGVKVRLGKKQTAAGKRFFSFMLILLMVISLSMFAGCGGSSGGSSEDEISDLINGTTTASTDSSWSTFDVDSLMDDYDAGDYVIPGSGIVYIDLDQTPISITGGTGASADGSVLTISSSGTYSISGSLSDGRIIVDTEDEEVVRLIFNGISVACADSAPFYVANAQRTAILLADGTSNSLTDPVTYTSFDDPGDTVEDSEPNAALHSKDYLTIGVPSDAVLGNGSLTVNGNYLDGITSKDGLIINGGTITVTAVDDGIRGKDYLVVLDGTITVTAGGDGLKSDNTASTDEEYKGFVSVEGGYLNIESGGDGIQAESYVVASGGDFYILSGGGAGTYFYEENDSKKGIKGGVGVLIEAGGFDIDSADDAVHSNDFVVVYNGTFDLASGDDAIHSELLATINGGVINVSESYEGIESMVITINDGEIHVQSTDDPINATDGNRGEDTPGVCIYINGGYSYFNCVDADGFDANGAVVMTGGTVIVNGPVSGANGILDYGTFTMSGGTIIGAGTSNMAQAPGGGSSTQNALLLIFEGKSAGTLFHLETSDGTDVITFAPAKDYASIVYSSSALVTGTAYNVFFGGTYTGGSVKDGIYTGGTYSGGTEDTTLAFTITTNVTQIGEGGGVMPPGGGGRG